MIKILVLIIIILAIIIYNNMYSIAEPFYNDNNLTMFPVFGM